MKEHLTVVGVLQIGWGILGMIAACAVLAGTVGPGAIALMVEGDALPLGILSIIGGSIATFVLVLSVPEIIGGIGILKHKPWARYLVMILAALDLVKVPIGTIFGAYTLWVLVQDKTAEWFA